MDLRRTMHTAAKRAARRVPAPVREVGLALAARAIDGPSLLPGPPPGPVLVIAPHPDDETIGPGGALARHAARGDEIVVLVASSGERTSGGSGDVRAVREAECVAACANLGVGRAPVFLHLPDGDLVGHVDALAEALGRHGGSAATVYAPSVLDPHRDHRAVNVGLVRSGLDAEVYGYEIWSAAPVDVLLDVTATFDRKERALRCYRTALRTVDYVRTAQGLAAYRSAAGGLGGLGYAEGFTRLTAAEHATMVHRAGLMDPQP
jgi:LmbE family N-acetylglucosaminyl deacetylase